MYILDNISLSSVYNEKSFGQTCRENQNTYFMYNDFIFRENLAFLK